MSAVLAYVDRFDRVEDLCSTAMPSDTATLKAFLKGIQPEALRDRVKYESPKDTEEAKRALFKAVEKYQTALRVVDDIETPVVKAETPRAQPQHNSRPAASAQTRPASFVKAKPSHNTNASTPRFQPTCHGCGHKGHLRPECPNKDRPGYTNVGKASNAIPLKMAISETNNVLRCPVVLRPFTPTGSNASTAAKPVEANALVDTGSDQSFISKTIYEQLNPMSVNEERLITTANGVVKCSLAAIMNLTCLTTPHPVGATVSMYVLDTGEDVIVGYNLINSLGLLSRLATANMKDVGDIGEVSPLDEEGANESGIAAPIENLIEKYQILFEDNLPATPADVRPMMIELQPGSTPTHQPPRRLSKAMEDVVNKEVETLLQQGIIRPSTSPFAAPAFVVPKKDGTSRMVIDYRRLNTITVDFRYPMQSIKSILSRLSGSQCFITLDLRSGYHQFPVTKEDIQKTAFTTPSGLYEFSRVPFGLKNAPAAFQRGMMIMLAPLLGHGVECYLDDIVVHGPDDHSLTIILEKVFIILKEHNLRLKRSKCVFSGSSLEYVGHLISKEGTAIAPWRREALQHIKEPSNASEVRSFCGLANYYRDFVANFATTMAPLYDVCSEKKFKWDTEQELAFINIKDAITKAPVLGFIDYSKNLVIKSDASKIGCGAALLQQDPVTGTEQPIAFVSRKFTSTEANWATIEQEAYAMFFAITKFDSFIRGHTFEVQTDHRNLLHMAQSETAKVVRWSLRLQEYTFVVHHIPGAENLAADLLSRCLRMVTDQHSTAIAAVHGPAVGHMGAVRTTERLRQRGQSWPGMLDDVKAFVNACPICQKVREVAAKTATTLRPTFHDEPFATVACDTMGPYPTDEFGNSFILVFIDAFTRFVTLVPTKAASAIEAKRALLMVTGMFGAPITVRSDQGSQFTASLFRETLREIGCRHYKTLAYHHQANGLVERANKEVGRHLTALTNDMRVTSQWSLYLPLVQRIINSQPHSATGFTPSTLVFGNAVNLDRGFIDDFKEGRATSQRT